MIDKQALRQKIKAIRQRTSMIQMAELSARICERVLAMPSYLAARTVLCYASLPGEVETHALLAQMLADGKRVCLPKVRGDGVMDAVCIESLSDTRIGPFGIVEPVNDAPVAPTSIDLLLIPGIAFDRCGRRLGHGAGYFDRYLTRTTGRTLALAYGFQLVDAVPQTATDVRVDGIVTESGVIDVAMREPKQKEIED